MLQNFNFNHLYYFHVIAREGSIAAASDMLNVSQPTLSQQLKQLEVSLGHDLFDRRKRSLELNAHGEYLAHHTKDIFEKAEEMISGFSYRLSVDVEKHFVLGLTPSIGRSFASYLLSPLFANEKIGVTIVESELDHLVKKMQANEVDFIFSEFSSSCQLNKGLEMYEIGRTKTIFVCGRNLKNKIDKFPDDLNGKPYFKYMPDNNLQRTVDRFFYDNNIRPRVVGESDDIPLIVSATRVNHCFSLVPEKVANEGIRNGDLFKIQDFDQGDSRICGIYLKERDNDEVQQLMNQVSRTFDQAAE